uniref:Uncharacterized protein n=1 Tax=Glossina austeni TaxID=7395 RepID=A0A1A9V1R5_GLOAU
MLISQTDAILDLFNKKLSEYKTPRENLAHCASFTQTFSIRENHTIAMRRAAQFPKIVTTYLHIVDRSIKCEEVLMYLFSKIVGTDYLKALRYTATTDNATAIS